MGKQCKISVLVNDVGAHRLWEICLKVSCDLILWKVVVNG